MCHGSRPCGGLANHDVNQTNAGSILAALASLVAFAMVIGCGTETVVQTVVVKEEVPIEVPVTVEVEKQVVVQGETVVQTVEVEKQVIKEVTADS